jgi:hypothetical protein
MPHRLGRHRRRNELVCRPPGRRVCVAYEKRAVVLDTGLAQSYTISFYASTTSQEGGGALRAEVGVQCV